MKKIPALGLFLFLAFTAALTASVFADSGSAKSYEARGEVVSADPLYSRVTIRHEAIKGFASAGDTEFFVESADLLKNIGRGDLVRFSFQDKKGDVRIDQLTKTGVASPKDDRLKVGQAVQDVLVATGEVAKTVTAPIPPAHGLVSGTVDATTDTTDAVLKDATTEVKQKF
jgi:Cu/Ag efflux protein CusF